MLELETSLNMWQERATQGLSSQEQGFSVGGETGGDQGTLAMSLSPGKSKSKIEILGSFFLYCWHLSSGILLSYSMTSLA